MYLSVLSTSDEKFMLIPAGKRSNIYVLEYQLKSHLLPNLVLLNTHHSIDFSTEPKPISKLNRCIQMQGRIYQSFLGLSKKVIRSAVDSDSIKCFYTNF